MICSKAGGAFKQQKSSGKLTGGGGGGGSTPKTQKTQNYHEIPFWVLGFFGFLGFNWIFLRTF